MENGTHFSGEGHLIEAVIFGDPNKTVTPVVCDSEGRLIIDLSSTVIEIGTVDQGTPNTLSNGWSVKITDGTNVLGTAINPINTTGTTVIVPSVNGVNIFATNSSIPFGIETTLLTYTTVTTLNIKQFIGWGTYDGEFLLRLNGVIVGGGRTSAAQRTLDINYDVGVSTSPGDLVEVTILEYGPGIQQFRANLIGE